MSVKTCPRCGKQMRGIVTWHQVQIGYGDPYGLCKDCAEEAAEIDEAYDEACTRAKRKWLRNPSIDIATLLPGSLKQSQA